MTRLSEIERGEGAIVQFSSNAEPTESLERALVLAAEAGQWSVVAQLGKELEARRLAGTNVTTLRDAASVPMLAGRRRGHR